MLQAVPQRVLACVVTHSGRIGNAALSVDGHGASTRFTVQKRTHGERSSRPRRQPVELPSNAQLLSAFVLFAVVIVLGFVGSNYINLEPLAFRFLRLSLREGSEETSPRKTSKISSRIALSRNPSGPLQLNRRYRLCLVSSRNYISKAPSFALLPFLGLVGYTWHDKTIHRHRYAGCLI